MENSAKKVLIVCSIYRPHIGGVETSIEMLAKHYQDAGVDVAVLTKRYPMDLAEYEVINEVPIVRIKNPKSKSDYFEALDVIESHEELLTSDIVHTIGIRRPMPFIGLLLSRHWNARYVTTFSGGDVLDPGDIDTEVLWEEGKHIVPQSVIQADWHVAFSKSIADQARNSIPELTDIDIVYGGIDVAHIQSVPKFNAPRPYIIAVRRLLHSKGIDILINAFAQVSSEYTNYDLYVVGDGPEKEALEDLVKKHGIQDRVLFLGNLPYDDMLPYLRGADIHVCPSRGEGGGLINFEAQAAGAVPVGSDAGGIPEYIDNNSTGFLFASGNVASLTSLLQKLLSDQSLREETRDTATKKIVDHDWKSVAHEYLNGYTDLLSQSTQKSFEPWSALSENVWKYLSTQKNN